MTTPANKRKVMKKNKEKEPVKGRFERRTYEGRVEIRAEQNDGEGNEESRTVEGYAAVFNEETDMFWWKERIAPGAFSGVLNNDVRALFNHDPNFILARSNNTLELWEDKKGLGYRFEAPNTTAGNDLLENLRNGNITQSSFGFTIEAYEWEEREEEDEEVVTITKVGRLFDVSPVTFPAYETTEVTARQFTFDPEAEKKETIIATVSTDELQQKITEEIERNLSDGITIRGERLIELLKRKEETTGPDTTDDSDVEGEGPDAGQQEETKDNGVDLSYVDEALIELTPPNLL